MRGRPGFAADWAVLGSAALLNYSLAAYQVGWHGIKADNAPAAARKARPSDCGLNHDGTGVKAHSTRHCVDVRVSPRDVPHARNPLTESAAWSPLALQDGKDVFQPQLLLPPLEDDCPSPPGNDSTPAANGTAPDGGNPSPANGTGALRQVASQPQLMDYGTVYASQSFEAEDGRRVWFGWAYEVRTVCGLSCPRVVTTARLGWTQPPRTWCTWQTSAHEAAS